MKTTILLSVLILISATTANADDSSKKQLIEAIRMKPKCDVSAVDELTKSARANLSEADKVEVIVERLKNLDDCQPKETTEPDPVKGNQYRLTAYKQIWKSWHEDFFPSSMKQLKKDLPIDEGEIGKQAHSVGVIVGQAQLLCKAGNSEACTLEKLISSTMPNEIAELEKAKNKKSSGSSKNPCDLVFNDTRDDYRCEADLEKKMRGTSSLKSWMSLHAIVAATFRLGSLTNDLAMYYSPDYAYAIGLKRATVKRQLQKDMELLESADCVKYGGEKTGKNLLGFPVKIKVYEAVKCPKGLESDPNG